MFDSEQEGTRSSRTIDQILASGEYRQDAFTADQQKLLRQLFLSEDYTFWVPIEGDASTRDVNFAAPVQEDATTHRIEPAPTVTAGARLTRSKRHRSQSQTCAQNSRQSARSSTRRCPQNTSQSCAPHSHQSTRPAKRLRQQDASQNARPEPRASVRRPEDPTQTPREASPSRQPGPRKSERHVPAKITATDVLDLYRPVDNPALQFSKLEDFLSKGHELSRLEGLDHLGRIAGTYIRAREVEDVSKILSKLTAVVWAEAYSDRRILKQEYDDIHRQTGIDVERVKDMVKNMTHDGRILLEFARYFGAGIVCLLGNIRKWKLNVEFDKNCREIVHAQNPQLQQHCSDLEKPTQNILQRLRNNILWQPPADHQTIASQGRQSRMSSSIRGVDLGAWRAHTQPSTMNDSEFAHRQSSRDGTSIPAVALPTRSTETDTRVYTSLARPEKHTDVRRGLMDTIEAPSFSTYDVTYSSGRSSDMPQVREPIRGSGERPTQLALIDVPRTEPAPMGPMAARRTTGTSMDSEDAQDPFSTLHQTTWTPETLKTDVSPSSCKAGTLVFSRTLFPPRDLSVYENLLRNVRAYFMYTCGNMKFDDDGVLLRPDGAKFYNNFCTDFDSYCFTATMLMERGEQIEGGSVLSRAFTLIKPILEVEHPRTLACFFEVLIHLVQFGFLEVASMLRRFIKEMAAVTSRKREPWSRICRLLGELDEASILCGLAQCWEAIADTFDSVLGTANRLAVSVRLDYIKRVVTDPSKEEILLRRRLDALGNLPTDSTPRVKLNLARNLHRQGRHDEAEGLAQSVLQMLQHYNIYRGRFSERIESLKTLSHSQHSQGKTAQAQRNMQQAIGMIVKEWGAQHPWALEFKIVVEGWFRSHGRYEDADALKREIEDLATQDVIEE